MHELSKFVLYVRHVALFLPLECSGNVSLSCGGYGRERRVIQGGVIYIKVAMLIVEAQIKPKLDIGTCKHWIFALTFTLFISV